MIGVIKAYTTRVGSGPFPTELFDADGEKLWKVGGEVGVSTGRDRRCGWYDAVIARYATRVNGLTDLFLTKLDVLSSWERVPVCVAYDVDGVRHDEMPMTQTEFHHATPIYEYLAGWWEDISGCRDVRRPARQRPGLRAGARGDVRHPHLGRRRRPRPRADPRRTGLRRWLRTSRRQARRQATTTVTGTSAATPINQPFTGGWFDDRVSTQPELARRLGLGDAVVIGLGSMIGAGVFAAFAPAARAAGSWLLVGLAIAAVVAYCNATSSAQLAAAYPRAGGTYLYGREVLGEWWGFLAGWGFVVGKTASCAAMAMTFAAYAVPEAWQRPVAAAVVVVLALVNCAGITRTAGLTRIIVALVLVALAVAVAAALGGGEAQGLGEWDVAARRLRRAPVGRAAVLRVRRVRPDRHARRGGPRARARHPARDRGRPGRRGRRVRRRRGRRADGARTRGHWPPPPSRSPTRWPPVPGTGPMPVVRVGAALAAAGALLALVAGPRPHLPGDGPRGRPAALAGRACTRGSRCRTAPS